MFTGPDETQIKTKHRFFCSTAAPHVVTAGLKPSKSLWMYETDWSHPFALDCLSPKEEFGPHGFVCFLTVTVSDCEPECIPQSSHRRDLISMILKHI